MDEQILQITLFKTYLFHRHRQNHISPRFYTSTHLNLLPTINPNPPTFEDDKIVVVGNDFKIEIIIRNQPSRAPIARFLKAGKYAERVGVGAPLYLAAVLEYLADFLDPFFSNLIVLRLAGNAARDNKKTRIVRRHIQLAVGNEEELSKLLGDVTIANGGVMPNINNLLLLKKVCVFRVSYVRDMLFI
uniref:Histone H2A C-terminal domain-containing protein n=1 Tax=Lactuca sativa TaxID=4236 RepID=A0A9R1VFA7_LACSA|nr:hypothetical protein LSAT_V11C500274420 [Lactuca sativa]